MGINLQQELSQAPEHAALRAASTGEVSLIFAVDSTGPPGREMSWRGMTTSCSGEEGSNSSECSDGKPTNVNPGFINL